jgi:hypothetical protein
MRNEIRSLSTRTPSQSKITSSATVAKGTVRPQGDANPSEDEVTDAKFVDPAAPPEPLHPPTGHALELLRSYLDTGTFQLR